jgi:hypothetical protein
MCSSNLWLEEAAQCRGERVIYGSSLFGAEEGGLMGSRDLERGRQRGRDTAQSARCA